MDLSSRLSSVSQSVRPLLHRAAALPRNARPLLDAARPHLAWARANAAPLAAAFVAVPLLFRGTRSVHPRSVRAALNGPVWLGFASLAAMGASVALRRGGGVAAPATASAAGASPGRRSAGDPERWRLPNAEGGTMVCDDSVASAMSGH